VEAEAEGVPLTPMPLAEHMYLDPSLGNRRASLMERSRLPEIRPYQSKSPATWSVFVGAR